MTRHPANSTRPSTARWCSSMSPGSPRCPSAWPATARSGPKRSPRSSAAPSSGSWGRRTAYGASLLKFGGDALLLFFQGERHYLRAAAAAGACGKSLRDLGRLKTSAGLVSLRMSVGVHSGSFDFFMVGDSHRELIVAGPAATATTVMESAASAGQILLSPATAALLPKRNVGEALGPGFLLQGSGRG